MNTRLVCPRVLLCVLILGMVSLCTFAAGNTPQTSPSTTSLTPVPPVANPCPRSAPGSVIQQPPALFSRNGVLSVRFSWQTTLDYAGRTLYCFMTPDGLENPTLHINPGDHLVITVTNNTPALGFMMTLDPPLCGPGGSQMTFSSVNIHYHGTNTSPTCHQDEVIKTLVNSGQTFQYNVAFPSNEPPGLYWYHPHVHGIAEKSVLGGGAGAIVIDGIQNIQHAVSGLRQRILVVRDQPTVQFQEDMLDEGAGGDPNGIPFQDVTVNNITTNTMTDTTKNPPVTTYTPAILHMQPGETQFWRVCNCSADTILDLQVQFDGAPQPFQVVAVDGVPVNSQDGSQVGSPITLTHFRLPMASRVEFLVKAPSPTVRLAQLVTLNILTGADGDDDPNRPLFDIQLSAQDDDQSAQDDTLPQVATASAAAAAAFTRQQRFAGMASAPIAAHRTLFFNENEDNFFMDVVGVPEHVFDPNAPPAITATQGTVEEWVVQNRTQENHEFHLHQTHFLVESQNNFAINHDAPAPGIVGQYLDMVEVPAWDGNPNHPYPSVTMRVDFRGPDIGDFVFHCHILEHEDGGMMQIIRVLPPGSSTTGAGLVPPRHGHRRTVASKAPASPNGSPASASPDASAPAASSPGPPAGAGGSLAPPAPGGMGNMPGMGHMNLK